MATNISHNPAETIALGAAWGRAAESGLVIGLCGELGAGKTQLAKGLAQGLGTLDPVHSPTFSLVNIYAGGRLTLFHLDLYRLSTPDQIIAAGLEEYLQPNGVSVIEWPERWFGDTPESQPLRQKMNRRHGRADGTLRWVKIEILGPAERRIYYEDFGT